MSREIKFRAKRLDNNQWVIGYYLPTQYGEKHFIYFALEFLNEHTRIEIDPKTLGQFTGLKDKNGKEIYEGDSVQKIYKGKAYQVCEVKFNDGTFVVDDFDADGKKFFWSLRGMQHCWKVVGNIYEHKYLLDKNQEENV